jgi:hypothetical protein
MIKHEDPQARGIQNTKIVRIEAIMQKFQKQTNNLSSNHRQKQMVTTKSASSQEQKMNQSNNSV